jgi:hypothetical protein
MSLQSFAKYSAATYHGAGENKCEKNDPDALRTMFAVFG